MKNLRDQKSILLKKYHGGTYCFFIGLDSSFVTKGKSTIILKRS